MKSAESARRSGEPGKVWMIRDDTGAGETGFKAGLAHAHLCEGEVRDGLVGIAWAVAMCGANGAMCRFSDRLLEPLPLQNVQRPGPVPSPALSHWLLPALHVMVCSSRPLSLRLLWRLPRSGRRFAKPFPRAFEQASRDFRWRDIRGLGASGL